MLESFGRADQDGCVIGRGYGEALHALGWQRPGAGEVQQGLRDMQALAVEGHTYAMLTLGHELLNGRVVQQDFDQVRFLPAQWWSCLVGHPVEMLITCTLVVKVDAL